MDALLASFERIDFLALVLAVVLGGAVGLERERRGRPAGLRTHVLVCLSSTMVILISREIDSGSLPVGDGRIVLDPNRMGAGIVTGIGFLGGATVLRVGDLVRGITTAACIWYVAGLGIVLGRGEHVLGAVGTLMVLGVLVGLSHFERHIPPLVYRRLVVDVHVEHLKEASDRLIEVLRAEGVRVLEVSATREAATDDARIEFYVSLRSTELSPHIVDRLVREPEVRRASWQMLD